MANRRGTGLLNYLGIGRGDDISNYLPDVEEGSFVPERAPNPEQVTTGQASPIAPAGPQVIAPPPIQPGTVLPVSTQETEQAKEMQTLLQEMELIKTENQDLTLSDMQANEVVSLLKVRQEKMNTMEAVNRRLRRTKSKYTEQAAHEKATGRPWWQDVVLALGLGPQRYLGQMLQASEQEKQMKMADEQRLKEGEQEREMRENEIYLKAMLEGPKEESSREKIEKQKLQFIESLSPEGKIAYFTGQLPNIPAKIDWIDKEIMKLNIDTAKAKTLIGEMTQNPDEVEKRRQVLTSENLKQINLLERKKKELTKQRTELPKTGILENESELMRVIRERSRSAGGSEEEIEERALRIGLKLGE